MKTTLHYYYLCVDKAEDKAAYKALCETLRSGSKLFDSISLDNSKFYKEQIKPLDGQTVELETAYLFGNQWNTAPCATSDKGLRVFDWSEAIYPNRDVKEGMYLDLTPEMIAIRETTYICGYCGKNYPHGAPGFCHACLDSVYLKSSELFLLRLLPITEHHHTNRPPLTESESAALIPAYTLAQTTGSTSRANLAYLKEGEDIEKEYRQATAEANVEYQGKKWLHDRRIPLGLAIYYTHTGRFCFGWRSALSPSVAAELTKKLDGFPFPYDLKVADN